MGALEAGAIITGFVTFVVGIGGFVLKYIVVRRDDRKEAINFALELSDYEHRVKNIERSISDSAALGKQVVEFGEIVVNSCRENSNAITELVKLGTEREEALMKMVTKLSENRNDK